MAQCNQANTLIKSWIIEKTVVYAALYHASHISTSIQAFEKSIITLTFQMRKTRPSKGINQVYFFNAKAMFSVLNHDTTRLQSF